MRKFRLLAAAAALFLATTANAGALLSATYSQTVLGVPFTLGSVTGGSPTGTLVGNTFTLDAGNAFAFSFCLINPLASACLANPLMRTPALAIKLPAGPLTTTGLGTMTVPPLAAPVANIDVTFTMNGPLVGTTGDPSITVASGVMGLVRVIGKIGKAPAFTLIPIPVNGGAGGNFTTPNPTVSPYPGTTTGGSPVALQVRVAADVWHIGTVTQTMLTSDFVALPDATGMGNVSVTAMGNTHVNLVSLGRTRVRGLANSDTSTPTFLRLVYAPSVPEPGTLMLLGAGVAGLALIGRRKLR
jgi:hypothetical protein